MEALLSDPSSELTPQIRAAIKAKWQKIVGPDTEIVVRISLILNNVHVSTICFKIITNFINQSRYVYFDLKHYMEY